MGQVGDVNEQPRFHCALVADSPVPELVCLNILTGLCKTAPTCFEGTAVRLSSCPDRQIQTRHLIRTEHCRNLRVSAFSVYSVTVSPVNDEKIAREIPGVSVGPDALSVIKD